MSVVKSQSSKIRRRIVAALALVFGAVTVFSAGNVLFGADIARELVGNFIPFIVWFNFAAGFLYIVAAVGIWLGRNWALGVSLFIAAATALAAVIFSILVMQGSEFEVRTIGALVLRIGFWAAISVFLFRN